MQDLKQALQEARAAFNERKRIEWEQESQTLRDDLDQAVWAAHDDGMSVNAIMRAYGTKDRRTITDILARNPKD